MTTSIETKATKTQVKRAKPVKRDMNAFGKFCAKVRIDAGLTSVEYAKALGVSGLSITNVERGDNKLSFDLALKIGKLIQEKAPHYEAEFASIVANELGVLLIPAHATAAAVEQAYFTLVNFTGESAE